MSTFELSASGTPLRDQRNRTGNPAAAGARPHTGTRPLEPRLQRELRSTQPRRRTKRHVRTPAVHVQAGIPGGCCNERRYVS